MIKNENESAVKEIDLTIDIILKEIEKSHIRRQLRMKRKEYII